jgi:catechol 2,3-dioxygenase-like lactoylglutathione lyase family enzyme
MEMKLELIIVPVSNVDRAKDFYTKIGFNADHDFQVNENLRFVQLTPPGSACSIAIGEGLTTMKPGSVEGLQAVVKDATALYEELTEKGVEATKPETMPWGTFVYFTDPDGNKWALQEMSHRQ